MAVNERIYAHLEAQHIHYHKLHHEAVTTSAEAAAARGVDLRTGAKALLVKNKNVFVVFVVPGDSQLDWKGAKRAMANKSARFASAEEMLELTGLVKGSLPPFGNLFGLAVCMDNEVAKQPIVRFNAGSLTESIEMSGSDLVKATGASTGDFASA